MEYRTYEADKYGKITVYPSLHSSARKSPDILKALIKKIVEVVRGFRKSSSRV